MITQYFAAGVIMLATLAFVWYRCARTNIEIPPDAEEKLGARDALRFALDNDLPITQTVIYVNPREGEPLPAGIGHNGGPSIGTWPSVARMKHDPFFDASKE